MTNTKKKLLTLIAAITIFISIYITFKRDKTSTLIIGSWDMTDVIPPLENNYTMTIKLAKNGHAELHLKHPTLGNIRPITANYTIKGNDLIIDTVDDRYGNSSINNQHFYIENISDRNLVITESITPGRKFSFIRTSH